MEKGQQMEELQVFTMIIFLVPVTLLEVMEMDQKDPLILEVPTLSAMITLRIHLHLVANTEEVEQVETHRIIITVVVAEKQQDQLE